MNTIADCSEDVTVIIHGVWMHGSLMRLMAARLKSRGLKTHTVSYSFLKKTPVENAQRLQAQLSDLNARKIHLVGHSLGGIVILHMLELMRDVKIGKIVLIGSPVHGSCLARSMYKVRMLRPLLGRSVEQGLLGGAPGFSSQRPLGIITGNLPFGLPSLFSISNESSDGVVLKKETRVEGATDHVSLPLSHSTLIFSRRCSEYIANFLETGQFKA